MDTPHPTPERPAIPDLPPAGPDKATQLIEGAVARVIGSEGFIERLATAIASRQAAGGYPNAVPAQQLSQGFLIGEPVATEQGNILALSQVPVQGGQNVCVVVLAKDNALVGQPRVEGEELANFTSVLYIEETPGLITGRKVFDLANLGDPQLLEEFHRQLKLLRLGSAAFFFLNILQHKA